MIRKSKLAIITAVLMVAVASPAFADCMESGAQESCGGPLAQSGYGSYAQVWSAPQPHFRVRRRHGWHAFARVPNAGFGSSLDPSATGGGSIGYNEHIKNDY